MPINKAASKYLRFLFWKCRVPRKTQWFCWSLSLLNGYFIGGIPLFQTYPHVCGNVSECWWWSSAPNCTSPHISRIFLQSRLIRTLSRCEQLGNQGFTNSVHVLQAYLQDAQDLCNNLLNLCVNLLIYHIWLVVSTILRNDGVRQWEGWHLIYEMENKIHVWNILKPPTKYGWETLSSLAPYLVIWKTSKRSKRSLRLSRFLQGLEIQKKHVFLQSPGSRRLLAHSSHKHELASGHD